MMNYQETLEYLYANLPMFSRSGASAYKKDVTNTALLCEAIGNPQHRIKTIHVAGTNGKGSTSHMLAAVFQQGGYKTGLYTSPHLKDFRERIRIDGKMIPEDFIVSFVENIKKTSEAINPSFFELTVAMMLAWFAEQNVDMAVIETGLGGRLDSTNIIQPALSIITNIGYDHMNILGNTLQEIAIEKAGIIKAGAPVVIGETLPETKDIFLSVASSLKADILFAAERFMVTAVDYQTDLLKIELEDITTHKRRDYSLDLVGIYQQNNLRTVITALGVLAKKGFSFDDKQILSALGNVKSINGLRGRWDIIQRQPLIVLDVAHNEDGIKQLLSQLSLLTFKKLHIVFGIVRDKEVAKILALLPKEAAYYFTRAKIPRALPENELMAKAGEYALYGTAYPGVNEALSSAQRNAGAADMILVCGSVYVVGEVDDILKQ